MVGRTAVALPALLAMLALAAATANMAADSRLPRLLAQAETALLSDDDRVAAYDAETAVLSQRWGIAGYHWRGPDGAYGTIISGAEVPEAGGQRICRQFIHIVHHKADGGANPTFQGRVCRLEGGFWSAE